MNKTIINKINLKEMMIAERYMNKRGQVTIFVILALVIVGVVVAIFAFPEVNVFSDSVNPGAYLKSCIEPEITLIKDTLSEQGGYANPTHYTFYQDMKLQYLCYTTENYLPCTVQQPLLLRHIEKEMKSYIEPRAKQCLQDLKNQYEKRGYSVSSGTSEIIVSVVPQKVIVDFNAPLTITKESTQTFQKFAVAVDSQWYDLIGTAVSIIQYESSLGDSETSLYISYYPNLKIDKTRRDDGSTIYQLGDVTTNDKFSFATKSLVWPQGYQ
ncbi:MAG: hypothetical protein ACP5NS_04660 [Candidatus Pacearchaeota archaeon]